MLAFVLIVTMSGQQKIVGMFADQAGCQQMATMVAEQAQAKKQQVQARCYQHVFTAVSSGN